jgi:hypothetical protein
MSTPISSPITMMIVRSTHVIPVENEEPEKAENTAQNPQEETPSKPDGENPQPAKEYTGIFAEVGTKASGFVTNGKQYCGDCIHNQDSVCYHPAVMADPELQTRKTADGGIKIVPEKECCRYIRKVPDDDYSEAND